MAEAEFYAHSDLKNPGKLPEDGARWQKLEDHLKQTAELARRFAASFGAGCWRYLAGITV